MKMAAEDDARVRLGAFVQAGVKPGINWEGVLTLKVNSFDHARTSALGGLTRTLAFYGTLMNQVGGSIPEECNSPGDTNCLLL
jgi:hypothetical protein